ncbi:hypothetical protein PhCBS80983_g01583 [Powellomyces hirtus]|uniref:EndoU domain-containing protein n=1 Tax=Powellomyces hirtus TaxID=109895 RepID=A0A507EBT9_9FUNG|nr:hypothetical protein PhCBS80983_g01583 [Powellomyces hirtus]
MATDPLHELVLILKKIGFGKIKKFLKAIFHESQKGAAQSQPQQPPHQQQYQQPPQQQQWQPQPAQQPQQGNAWSNGAPHQQQHQPQPQQPQQHQPNNAWAQGAPQHQQQHQQHEQQAPHAPFPSAAPVVGVEPTREELASIAEAASKLWALDGNRLQPGRDFVLNLQQTTKVYGTADVAREPLFRDVSPAIFQQYPTYVHFRKLLDNYIAHGGKAEQVTVDEIREQTIFVEEISKTAPILYLHRYLVAKNLAPQSMSEFGKLLKSIWFDLYRRQAANDSSSFEHTFCGEIKGGETIGFHNWVQYHIEETNGNAEYRGWITPRGSRHATQPESSHILSFQLSWHGEVKPVSTFFIGTSPEFEIALYTLVFLAGSEDNNVVLDGVELNLKCHKFQSRGVVRLGSVYPVSG